MKKIIQKIAVGVGVLFLGIFGNSVHSEAEIPEYACFKADDVISYAAYSNLMEFGAACNRTLYEASKEEPGFSELTVFWSGISNEEFQKNPAYFYQLILTDLLQEQRSFDLAGSNVKDSLNTIQLKLKERAEKLWYNQDIQEIVADSVSLTALQNLYEGYLTAQEIQEYIGKLKEKTYQEDNWVGWNSATLEDIQDILDGIIVLKNVNENRIAVYKKMRLCCDNSLMELALNNMIAQYESQNDQIFDAVVKYGSDKILDSCQEFIKESTESLLNSMGLSNLVSGYKFGKFIGNTIFGADAVSESYLLVKSTVEVEDVIRKAAKACEQDYMNDKNPQTAAVFLESVDMLLSVAYYGLDTSDNFAYVTLEDTLASFISNVFFPNKDSVTYSKWKEVVNSNRKFIEGWENRFRFIYNSYKTVYVENGRLDHDVTETEKQERLNNVAYQVALKEATTPVVNENITLFMDTSYEGDLIITEGTLDLNGFTLTVNGEFCQEGGTVYINDGLLNVRGNLQQEDGTLDVNTGTVNVSGTLHQDGGVVKVNKGIINIGENYELFQGSAVQNPGGKLRMTSAEAVVSVNGNYITHARDLYGDALAAGTLKIKGDFSQYGELTEPFKPQDSMKIIFEGKEIPEVYFESSEYARFSYVEFKKGKVKFTGELAGFSLQQNLEIIGDMPIFTGTFDLNGYTLTVQEDLYQPSGKMDINGGTLVVNKNYKIFEEYIDETTGKSIVDMGGTLLMDSWKDTVIVNGDYITKARDLDGQNLKAGTLRIKGNFSQLGGVNEKFKPAEELKIIFDGKEIPEVYFEDDEYAKFSYVEFKTGKVKLSGEMTGFTLQQNLEIVGKMAEFTGTFNLNGYTMTVQEDLYQPSGKIDINGGTLVANKDYKIFKEYIDTTTGENVIDMGGTLLLDSWEDTVIVNGDYITKARDLDGQNLKAGTLRIRGNFSQLGGVTEEFKPKEELKIIFEEKEIPEVYFESNEYAKFEYVEFRTGKVKLSGKITGFTLQHDLTIVGEMPTFIGTFDLNGHTMNIQESFSQPSGTFKVNRGILNIAKDWNLHGIYVNEMTNKEEIVSGGSLRMQNVDDKVNVGGNLTISSNNSSDSLKAGTLTIGGNLEQYGGSYSFYATQLHKTILTGGASTEKPQTINFRNTNCRFQTLQLAKDRSYYQFNPDNCWQELVADEPLSIADAVLSLSAESFQYDGTEKKPEVTVVLGGSTLTADQDYTLVYENNTEVGTAKVTVTGIGLYQGTVEKEFTITCEHQWGESITKEPTCQEEGEKTITCEICGQTKTEKIEKADHQYGEWIVAKEPTKDTNGERKRACIWCGLEETEVIPALGWETVPDGTTVISEGAFQGNTTIREIILPDSLKEIQANAFENCGNLERVVLPEGVVAIGDGAFQNCPNLQEVVIPKTVTQIGTDAFKGCPNLIIFGEEGSFAQTYAEENGISFTVFQKNDLASCRWEVPGEFTYNGEEHRPEVKLFLAEKQLVQGIDYTVAYENNLNAGEAYINVTGIRTFQGVLKIPFAIQKAARPVQPEETVTKLYTDAPFKLETEGDGIFQYEVSNPQIAEVSSDGTVTIKAAGKTEIVIKEAETENYLEGKSVVALTVNPAPIRVSGILAQDKVFDGTTKAVLVTDQAVFEGKKESDQLSVEAQGSFVDANAGTGKTVLISGMKLAGTQSGNYVLDTAGQQQEAKASITKAQSVYSGRTEFTGTVGQSLSEITSGSGLTVAEYVFDQVGSFTNQAIYCPDSRNYELQNGIAITIQITCDSHTGGKADCTHRAVCEKCGQEYGEADPNGHQYTETVTKPTCTEGGYTTYTCRICQTSYQGNETKPAGHQLKDGVCTVCGYMELPAVGTTVTVGSLKYKIVSSTDEKQEVEVTAPVKKNLTSIEIPSAVKIRGGDYQVVSIASKAFRSCTNLKKVTIGANVRSIGSSAFSGCSSLKKAVTSTALQKIGNNAFYNCKALTSMTIGRNVNSIGSKAFTNCTKLRKAVIGSKVKKINTNTFYGCKSLTSVTIGNNVTSIGNGAFKNCSKLRKVTIPVKVKSIGKDAFRNSKNLKSVVIRGTALKSVGKNAFKGVNSRAVVKVPKKKLKAYQKLLKNKGLSKAAKISK